MTRGLSRFVWAISIFMMIASGTRIGLALFAGDHFSSEEWREFLTLGFVYDAVVASCFALPWASYDAFVPAARRMRSTSRLERIWAAGWAIAYVFIVICIAAMEFVFWSEFGSRFNFVAVDYLVYTHEVIGNIRQSYPVGAWLAAAFGVSLVVWWVSWPRRWADTVARRHSRFALLAFAVAACVSAVAVTRFDTSERDANVVVRELSMNGVYAFFYAFAHNELDYARYYPNLPSD